MNYIIITIAVLCLIGVITSRKFSMFLVSSMLGVYAFYVIDKLIN